MISEYSKLQIYLCALIGNVFCFETGFTKPIKKFKKTAFIFFRLMFKLSIQHTHQMSAIILIFNLISGEHDYALHARPSIPTSYVFNQFFEFFI